MGLFHGFKRKNNRLTWGESVQALNSGKISLQDFVNMNASRPLYYSTPAGENQEGQMTFWLLYNEELDTHFYPAFSSKKLCHDSFTSAGRKNFILIKGTLESALSSLDTDPILAKAGLMIEDENGKLAIPPQTRVRKKF